MIEHWEASDPTLDVFTASTPAIIAALDMTFESTQAWEWAWMTVE